MGLALEGASREVLRLSNGVEAWLEKFRFLVLGAFSLVYLAWHLGVAFSQPFWYDELVVAYLAGLNSVSDLWAAMVAGADAALLFNLAVRASRSLFGPTHAATRLPSILGFLLMSLCLFAVVRRRSNVLYAFAAILFPFITGAAAYATEARAYGMYLGLSALAVLCWQGWVEGRGRPAAIFGLGLTLALAVSTHLYAVLLWIPLGLAELVRLHDRKRVDWPVLAALAAGLVPLAILLPVARAVAAVLRGGVFSPWFGAVRAGYGFFLEPALGVFFVALAATLVANFWRPGLGNGPEKLRPLPPAHEVVLILGFLALPLFGFLLGKITGAFAFRYALPTILGFSAGFVLLVYHANRGSSVVGLAVILAMLATFWVSHRYLLRSMREPATMGASQRYDWLVGAGKKELPVIVGTPLSFLPMVYYGPPSLRPRLHYLVSPERSIRYLGTDAGDRCLLVMQKLFPVGVESYDVFLRTHPRFLLCWSRESEKEGWILAQLVADGARLELEALGPGLPGEHVLYLVTLAEAAGR